MNRAAHRAINLGDARQGQRLLRLPDLALQRGTFDVVQHDADQQIVFFQAVEAHDAGMLELRQGARFALKAAQEDSVHRQFFVQHFHGQKRDALGVPYFVNVGHRAAPDETIDAITVE